MWNKADIRAFLLSWVVCVIVSKYFSSLQIHTDVAVVAFYLG